MDTSMDSLASYFRPLAEALLDDCAALGVPCRVVNTGRSTAEQLEEIAKGQSWTTHSKHEPQEPEAKSEAIDIVPVAILAEKKTDWDPTNPLWDKIGPIGEELGLEWGGRWTHLNGGNGDKSHFQYIHAQEAS